MCSNIHNHPARQSWTLNSATERTEALTVQSMRSTRTIASRLAGSLTLVLVCLGMIARSSSASEQNQESHQSASASLTAKPVGTVKALSGNVITVTTDAGAMVRVLVQDSTRLVRIAPGQKDLQDAAPVPLQELQVGDRILARGKTSDGGNSVEASSIVVMKESDVTAKQAHEREDWQKRGIGGLVNQVGVGSGIIVLSATAETKPVTIHVSRNTIVRRYSPDSVKFDDAKPGTLDQISAGDQLRARGVRSADDSEMAAEEIVSGTFRNIAGVIASTDSGGNTVSLTDLSTKKPVTVKITTDSQLRKLPLTVAQRIALRLRGEPADAALGTSVSGADPSAAKTTPPRTPGGSRPGGAPDFQQMLKRMPATTLAELQKGDAVMIVTTQGSATTQPIAIVLLSGVEPILSASPNSNRAAMLLSPWNLGGGAGDAAAGATQ
jgi:hypothetical protein